VQVHHIGIELRERVLQGRGVGGFVQREAVRKDGAPFGVVMVWAATVRETHGMTPALQLFRRHEDVRLGSAEGANPFMNKKQSHCRDGSRLV